MVLHRHWIVFVHVMGYIVALILSSIFILIFQGSLSELMGTSLFWWMMSLYWILFLVFTFFSWVNNELDLFVITTRRVIGIEQRSTLSRFVYQCGLDRVQEVNAERNGIFQTIFRYGKIHIRTASEHSDMIMNYAPDPLENVQKINSIIQKFKLKNRNVEI